MKRRTVCIDLAKDCFQSCLSDGDGRISERHRLSRARFTAFLVRSPVSRVVIGACGTAHNWARQLVARLPG